MRIVLFVVFLMTSLLSGAQMISGEIVDEGRKITSTVPFEVVGYVDGYATLELSVDRNGNVVSRRVVETDIKSTPSMLIIKNHVKTFKFEAGTYYPKFHHVLVKIRMTTK